MEKTKLLDLKRLALFLGITAGITAVWPPLTVTDNADAKKTTNMKEADGEWTQENETYAQQIHLPNGDCDLVIKYGIFNHQKALVSFHVENLKDDTIAHIDNISINNKTISNDEIGTRDINKETYCIVENINNAAYPDVNIAENYPTVGKFNIKCSIWAKKVDEDKANHDCIDTDIYFNVNHDTYEQTNNINTNLLYEDNILFSYNIYGNGIQPNQHVVYVKNGRLAETEKTYTKKH